VKGKERKMNLEDARKIIDDYGLERYEEEA
jgi:hypothetical protein